jgi:hypothetical protein
LSEPVVAVPVGPALTTGSLLADLNGDGVVDFLDISIFITCYSTLSACADLNGDGVVNFFDVSLFLQFASPE